MRLKKTVLILPVTFFLIFALLTNNTLAQVGGHRGGVHHLSFYLSGGYNKAKFFNSTVNIDQPSLNNKYQLLNATADSKTGIKSIFPYQLNYRLGCYFNFEQTAGFEFSYDPVNYHLVEGQNMNLTGTFNGAANTNIRFAFRDTAGYRYAMDGANFMLLNFVRRFKVYRPNSNNVGVDIVGKIGAGPVMPHFASKLAKDSFNAPPFKMYGWNAAAEAAIRVTIYRYAYVEIAGKYDYASYNKLPVYRGTAKQNLNTLEAIASIGVTLPSNRFNPLFFHGRKVKTFIPFFESSVKQDSLDKVARKEKKHKKKKRKKGDAISDIPEFESVLDKKAKFVSGVEKIKADSLAQIAFADSVARQIVYDSIRGKEVSDSVARQIFYDSIEAAKPRDTTNISSMGAIAPPAKETKKEKKARLKREKELMKNGEGVTPPASGNDSTIAPGSGPASKLSKKERKAKKKHEEQMKAEEAKEKSGEIPVTPPANGEVPAVPPAETPGAPPAEKLSKKALKAKKKEDAKALKEKEKLEKQADKDKANSGEATPVPPAEPAAPPAEKLSKKELKAKKKEEKKAAKAKANEEADAKDRVEQEQKGREKANEDQTKKDAADLKDKAKQEKEAKTKALQEQREAEKAKREQDKQDQKTKREQEKKDREEQKAKEKADREAEKERQRKEKEDKKNAEKKPE